MRKRVCIFALFTVALLVCIAASTLALAQAGSGNITSSSRWVGVWQGQLEGVPGVTLTLGDDLGGVSGTIVFTALRNGTVAGRAVHVILNPHVDGGVLFFQVKRPGSESEILDLSLVLADSNKGQLRCPKCGAAAVIEMVKLD